MRRSLEFIFILILTSGFCALASLPIHAGLNDWSDEIIYFVLLDRFSRVPSSEVSFQNLDDPYAFQGGSLRGLISKLDYLHDLGITAIWLSPIFKNRPDQFYGHHSYHGYWPWDFFSVDPRFGKDEDLRQLSSEMEKRGMKLLLDFVVNHAGYDAPMVSTFPDWFHQHGCIENWNDKSELETRSIYGLPDFASEKSIVQYFFRSVASHWASTTRLSGFRLDAVKHVQQSFWSNFNGSMRTKYGDDFLLLGEMMHGDPREVSETLKAGHFSTVFDFPLYYTLKDTIACGGDLRQLAVRLYEDRLYPDPNLLVTFLDNHDLDRFITSCNLDEKKYRMALSFLFAVRGIPALTYGNEVGLSGKVEPIPENRKPMDFSRNPDLRNFVRRLISMRKGHLSLSIGIQKHLHVSRSTYAFSRIHDKEAAIAVFNTGSNLKELHFKLPFRALNTMVIYDEQTGHPAKIMTDEFSCIIQPESSLIYFIKEGEADLQKAYEQMKKMRSDIYAHGSRKVVFSLAETGAIPDDVQVMLTGGLDILGSWKIQSRLPRFKKDAEGLRTIAINLPIGAVFECKAVYEYDGKTFWQPGSNTFLEIKSDDPQMRVVELHW